MSGQTISEKLALIERQKRLQLCYTPFEDAGRSSFPGMTNDYYSSNTADSPLDWAKQSYNVTKGDPMSRRAAKGHYQMKLWLQECSDFMPDATGFAVRYPGDKAFFGE